MEVPDQPLAAEEVLEDGKSDARIGWTLLGGLVLSVVIMAGGLVLVAIHGSRSSGHAVPLSTEAARLARGNPEAILDLGILLLFATPVAGVLVAGAEFVRQRDLAFVAIVAALLVILAAGFVIALR